MYNYFTMETADKRGYLARGLTIIELLVVIAIIALIAAVVLTVLGGTRGKGVDSSVKAQLHSAQSQAELYSVVNGNSYLGLCGAALVAGVKPFGVARGILAGAANPTGADYTTAINAAQTATNQVACDAAAATWVLQAPVSSGFWCVDSSGHSKPEPAGNLLPLNAIACP
jgi:prepilin-type N-terminal cleavage/methylation domain-containing protein